jgi:hypothetical protein
MPMNVYYWRAGSREPGVDHELIWGAIGLIALVAARFVPPALTDFYDCPFHTITGIPCLTCGMTRSFRHMVHGRFLDAFSLNPLGALFCIFTVLYIIYALAVTAFRLPRPRIRLETPASRLTLRLGLPGILLINWAYLCWHGV